MYRESIYKPFFYLIILILFLAKSHSQVIMQTPLKYMQVQLIWKANDLI